MKPQVKKSADGKKARLTGEVRSKSTSVSLPKPNKHPVVSLWTNTLPERPTFKLGRGSSQDKLNPAKTVKEALAAVENTNLLPSKKQREKAKKFLKRLEKVNKLPDEVYIDNGDFVYIFTAPHIHITVHDKTDAAYVNIKKANSSNIFGDTRKYRNKRPNKMSNFINLSLL